MEYLIADIQRMETGFLKVSRKLDMDIGGSDDFELTLSAEDGKRLGIDYGCALFVPETEYGGLFQDKWSSTAAGTVKWYGDTWRGMLKKKVVEPPEGLAYRTVSGEANAVIGGLFSGQFGDLILASSEDSGITVDYQIPRYVTLLEAITGMLKEQGARIRIRAVQGGPGGACHVEVSAVPVTDYSEELEYSQDNRIRLTVRDCRRGINHLICLGKGELTERLVLHLYVQEDGSIGREKHYSGLSERTAVFEYGSADDEATLEESGKKRLRELMDYQEMEMDVEDIGLELGDIVAGRDRETGIFLKRPVSRKIIKTDGLTETITYEVEGED